MRAVDGDAAGSVNFFVRMPNESVVAASIHFEGTDAEPEQAAPIALYDPYAEVTITEEQIRAIVHGMAASPEHEAALLADLYAEDDE